MTRATTTRPQFAPRARGGRARHTLDAAARSAWRRSRSRALLVAAVSRGARRPRRWRARRRRRSWRTETRRRFRRRVGGAFPTASSSARADARRLCLRRARRGRRSTRGAGSGPRHRERRPRRYYCRAKKRHDFGRARFRTPPFPPTRPLAPHLAAGRRGVAIVPARLRPPRADDSVGGGARAGAAPPAFDDARRRAPSAQLFLLRFCDELRAMAATGGARRRRRREGAQRRRGGARGDDDRGRAVRARRGGFPRPRASPARARAFESARVRSSPGTTSRFPGSGAWSDASGSASGAVETSSSSTDLSTVEVRIGHDDGRRVPSLGAGFARGTRVLATLVRERHRGRPSQPGRR